MPKKANNYITISYKVHLISVSGNISSKDPGVQALIDIINKYRKGYDQEGYIDL